MGVVYKEGTGISRRILFQTYVFVANSTEVGLAAAGVVSIKSAFDDELELSVRLGAAIMAVYLWPAVPLVTYVKSCKKAISTGKMLVENAPKIYKAAKLATSPVEYFNYLTGTALQKFGVNGVMEKICGVESCDLFIWE